MDAKSWLEAAMVATDKEREALAQRLFDPVDADFTDCKADEVRKTLASLGGIELPSYDAKRIRMRSSHTPLCIDECGKSNYVRWDGATTEELAGLIATTCDAKNASRSTGYPPSEMPEYLPIAPIPDWWPSTSAEGTSCAVFDAECIRNSGTLIHYTDDVFYLYTYSVASGCGA